MDDYGGCVETVAELRAQLAQAQAGYPAAEAWQRRAEQAEAAALALAQPCAWEESADGIWYTACGEAWLFEAGNPTDNGCRYCLYCGHPLTWGDADGAGLFTAAELAAADKAAVKLLDDGKKDAERKGAE